MTLHGHFLNLTYDIGNPRSRASVCSLTFGCERAPPETTVKFVYKNALLGKGLDYNHIGCYLVIYVVIAG